MVNISVLFAVCSYPHFVHLPYLCTCKLTLSLHQDIWMEVEWPGELQNNKWNFFFLIICVGDGGGSQLALVIQTQSLCCSVVIVNTSAVAIVWQMQKTDKLPTAPYQNTKYLFATYEMMALSLPLYIMFDRLASCSLIRWWNASAAWFSKMSLAFFNYGDACCKALSLSTVCAVLVSICFFFLCLELSFAINRLISYTQMNAGDQNVQVIVHR